MATAMKIPLQMSGGVSVAVIGQLGPDAVAHRYTFETVPRHQYHGAGTDHVARAACQPGVPAYAFTAAWADYHGAVACTEAACFPDANEPISGKDT